MRARTIVEKILASHARKNVHPRDIVAVPVDVVMATDGSAPRTIDLFKDLAAARQHHPPEVVLVIDHYVPCPNDKVAALHERMRAFREYVDFLYDSGEGVCHQLMIEKGHARPGRLVVGADSHSTTYGAVGCFGTGVGSSDAAAAMATGRLWFRVPETIRVRLKGALWAGATGKDLALWLVRTLGTDGANYAALEFCGEGVSSLSIDDRLTVCNMAVETGAKVALMPVDEVLRRWMRSEGIPSADGFVADPGASYDRTLEIDLSTIQPLVAAPHSPGNVIPAGSGDKVRVHQVVLGTCTNGRVSDFDAAARIIGRLGISDGVRVIVIPASRRQYLEAVNSGAIQTLVERGAIVLPPSCGPCCGAMNGVPGAGETVVSTSNRNFIGRMGNTKARIYLASSVTAAAAAVRGVIVDPREVLEELGVEVDRR